MPTLSLAETQARRVYNLAQQVQWADREEMEDVQDAKGWGYISRGSFLQHPTNDPFAGYGQVSPLGYRACKERKISLVQNEEKGFTHK